MTREEALTKIKSWYIPDDARAALSVFIPELAESEDERIRKAIVNHLLELSKSRVNLMTKATYENWIAWLEKQGEQQPAWSRDDEQNLNVCLGYIDDESLRGWLTDIIHIKYLNKNILGANSTWGDGDAIADEYIDLGLPSGTLWKSVNEEGYYTYNEAVEKFQSRLPQKYQCEELAEKCKWEWKDNGYKVTGPNGKSIFFPAAGFCYGRAVLDIDKYGLYWTSTYSSDASAYVLGFYDDHIFVDSLYRTTGRSVRLVK